MDGVLNHGRAQEATTYATGRLKKPQGPVLRTAVTLVVLRASPPDSAMRR